MNCAAFSLLLSLSSPSISFAMAHELNEKERTELAKNCVLRLTRNGMPQEKALAHLQELVDAEKKINDAHYQIGMANQRIKELAGERSFSGTDQKAFNQVFQYLLQHTDFNDVKRLFSNSNQ